MAQERRVEYLPLPEIQRAHRNPKAHALGDLASSIGRHGFVEPMVLDERTGLLVAGHGRLESLSALNREGAAEVPPEGVVVREDGVWMVPVLRGWASKSDADAEAYILASNQITAKGGWDNTALADMLRDLASTEEGISGTGFGADDVDKLLRSVSGKGPPPADKDDVPDEPQDDELYVEKGQMFRLGKHFIVCGDSTDPSCVNQLMGRKLARFCFTDPPWNVSLDTEASKGRPSKPGREIENDNLGEDFPQFCALFAMEMARIMMPGAPLYLVMSSSEWATIDGALKQAGFRWSDTLIWNKDSMVMSRSDYHRKFEPIWYGWKDGAARLKEVADRTQTNVWDIDRPKRSDKHPTTKPVVLIERALLNSSSRGDIVYEPFSGSGSTLIACEATGRSCRAIELAPKYVQVAIERWERFTGRSAERVD